MAVVTLSSVFGGNSQTYTGPDRRDPLAFDLGRRRWPAVAAVLGAAAAFGAAQLGDGSSTTIDTLGLVLGLGAGVLFLASWRIAGRVPDEMVGLGLCLAAPSLSLSSAGVAWFDLPLLAGAVLALGAALRAPQVTAAVGPLRAVVLVGGGLTLAELVVTRAPGSPMRALGAPTELSVIGASCWLALACAFMGHARALPRAKAHRLASAFLALGLACGLAAIDTGVVGSVGSRALLMAGLSILAVTAIANLRSAMRRQDERAGKLRRRLHRSEQVEHRHRELLHDARSALACIRSAHTTLARYDSVLDPVDRSQLEHAVRTELERLARLLDRDGSAPGRNQPYDVLAALQPLVVSYQQRGLDVVLRGRHATAAGDPDSLVEIVGNLLDNSLKHARGARATITIDESSSGLRVSVTDTGPGIPHHLRDTLFEPGIRGSTPGVAGEGLGLAVAYQLARGQGGGIDLIDTFDGAWFVIRLRRGTAPIDSPSRPSVALDGT